MISYFLQVANDGIGFMGPLLLNRLIRFLQQGVAAYEFMFSTVSYVVKDRDEFLYCYTCLKLDY